MSINKTFYLACSFLLMAAAFIFLSPGFITPEITMPLRYDSLYQVYHQQHRTNTATDAALQLPFNPGETGLAYESFQVHPDPDTRLDGWFVASEDPSTDQTIVLLHDLSKSRILLIEAIRQFHDRGFNVCTYDLRAHGSSGGKLFSLGAEGVKDLQAVLNFLKSKGITRWALAGSGVSCAIVSQHLLAGGAAAAVVMESPITEFETYLQRSATAAWGKFAGLWYPILVRQQSEILQFPVYQLNLTKQAEQWTVPVLFLAGTDDQLTFLTETYELFEHCKAPQKDLLLIKEAAHGELAAKGGEMYFNGISTFLNVVMPRRQKPSNRKRLALIHDQPGNNRPDTRDRTD